MQLNKFGITNKIWDDLMKQNENIDIIQNALTGALYKDVSGQEDVELSEMEATNGLLVFTGTLTDNVTVTVPNVPRVYHVQNQTSGDYTLTIKTGDGNGVLIQQASLLDHPRIKRVLCDGTDITWADGAQVVEDNLHEASPEKGYYVRYASGLQECWHEVNLTYVSANSLNTDWVFPQPFLSNTQPDVQSTLISYLLRGSIAVGQTLAFHSLFIRQISNTQVRPQAQSATGHSWTETDNLYVKCRAIGRWK